MTDFVAPPIEISEQGRLFAEEFLIEYTSMLSFGHRAQNGSFQSFLRDELLLDPPLTWFGFFDNDNSERWSNTDLFDREGNRVKSAVFIDEWGDIALHFELFDLDSDVIPEIIMQGGVPEACASFVRLFRFADGQYHQVEVGETTDMIISSFFFDYTTPGRLIAQMGAMGLIGYFHLDFTETGVRVDRDYHFPLGGAIRQVRGNFS